MSDQTSGRRTIHTPALGRVEGEGGMYVAIEGDRVRDVQLRIFEPPRFFEAFLRGRSFHEPPDITARICGICPVAYQMSACQAIEQACGVEVTGPLDDLRRLLYWGEWIESHSLHVHLLHAPDFTCVASGIELAELDRRAVERGLAVKKTGNALVDVIGGRPIHPVNVRVGGWYRVPRRRELEATLDELRLARDLTLEVVEWVGGLDRPQVEADYDFVALRSPGSYPVLHGQVVDGAGATMQVEDLDSIIEEFQVAHSTALHARRVGRGPYLVGPLARYHHNRDGLSPLAREAAHAAGLDHSCRNPFDSIVVRAVEMVHACDDAIRSIEDYEEPAAPAVPVEPRAGVGFGATEAPRGLLYHRYELAEDGTVVDATIVPPTSQNQPTIERDLWRIAQEHVDAPDDELRDAAERAIRNHDPCISCATHFLDLEVERR